MTQTISSPRVLQISWYFELLIREQKTTKGMQQNKTLLWIPSWRQVARWQTLQHIGSPCCERPHCGHCPRFQCGWRGWDRWLCGEWHPWFGRRRSRGASLQRMKTDFDEFRVSQTNTTTATLMSKTQRLRKTNRKYVRNISGVRKFYYFVVVKCSG